MPKSLIKSKLHFKKYKPKTKREINKTKSNLPPNFQILYKNYYQEIV